MRLSFLPTARGNKKWANVSHSQALVPLQISCHQQHPAAGCGYLLGQGRDRPARGRVPRKTGRQAGGEGHEEDLQEVHRLVVLSAHTSERLACTSDARMYFDRARTRYVRLCASSLREEKACARCAGERSRSTYYDTISLLYVLPVGCHDSVVVNYSLRINDRMYRQLFLTMFPRSCAEGRRNIACLTQWPMV